MPNFIGFNTIGQRKKFTLTDRKLIKRDLLNAFLIREGQVPGRPEVGTDIWNYIFDPNDAQNVSKINNEVERIINQDSRIELHEIKISISENTVEVAVSISLLPDSDVELFYLNFVRDSQTVAIN